MKTSELIDQLYKQASEKIQELEDAFRDPIAKKVAYMIATSHEYKKPNIKAALSFVKNYDWEVSSAKTRDLQGINKPIIEDKVVSMAKQMKGGNINPLVCVNQLHGIRHQSPGKKILLDGHHRIEACKINGVEEVPIYKGTYTGKAERSYDELKEKSAADMDVGNMEKTASDTIDCLFEKYSKVD